MNGIMNENQLTIVKEYELIGRLMKKKDSIIDNCIRGCHNEYFHTFKNKCVFNVQLTYISNKKIFNSTVTDKSKNLFELKKILYKVVLYLIK